MVYLKAMQLPVPGALQAGLCTLCKYALYAVCAMLVFGLNSIARADMTQSLDMT